MNRDDIIRMAREAGLVLGYPFTWENLERFANLIATHEREEYALICDADLIAAHEREECARMCEAYMAAGIGREMAAAIRARGE